MILGVVEVILLMGVAIIFDDGYEDMTNAGNNLCMLIEIALLVPVYFLDMQRVHDFEGNEILPKLLFGIGFYSIVFESGSTADVPDISNSSDYLGYIFSNSSMLDYVSLALGLYLLFNPGTKGSNMYGEDPLQ